VSVYAAVRNRMGRILLLQRSARATHFPSAWELPGGRPETGEDIETALRREIREETGLEISLRKVMGATDFRIGGRRIVCLVFSGTCRRQKVKLSEEHDTFNWVDPQELANYRLAEHFQPITGWKKML
jgi:8-oxo-dGTP diphosphatase